MRRKYVRDVNYVIVLLTPINET
ncbi:hypothetical protein ALC60_05527 [Trachymyrmex zeteki]|uniref:Uncharacterized protein n=1 Tax=Mycetomoellerius zeteki TaxID=64791 RepID=A0A151X5C6_9HYME|nr:hypothetical protein ALC60_05527 [Trachymyrmex zeteki]